MEIPADPALVALLERATAEAMAGEARESEQFWATAAEAVAAVPVDEVLAVAVTFCRADAPAMRATGAALLAELCNSGREWVDEVLGVLAPLLEGEPSADVVKIALHGVGLTRLPAGVAAAAPFAAHADPTVRLDATHALTACAGDPPAAEAVELLIALSGDADDEVRDWATFGLGTQIDADEPAIRDALARRLGDTHLDTRDEAVLGLARRGDGRAFDAVLEQLESDEVSRLTVEASGFLADERLLRPLLELGEWWEDDSDIVYGGLDVLKLAIARCDPAARERFDERTRLLGDAIERDLESVLPGSRFDGAAVVRAPGELTTWFELRYTDALGRPQDASFTIEQLFRRPDVDDDPERAAAFALATLAA